MRFVREWLRILFIGDSHLGRAVRYAGYLASIGVSIFGMRVQIQAGVEGAYDITGSFPVGLLLVVIVAVPYGLLTAGAAWVQSRGPDLAIADALEWDAQ